MKINKLSLIMLFACSFTLCHASILKLTIGAMAIPAVYASVKLAQANGDTKKTKRLIRKDKDCACTYAITTLQQNCDDKNKACKEIIHYLKQAHSTTLQLIEDTIQESIEPSMNTNIYKTAEKTLHKAYEAVKNRWDEWAQPKK